MRFLFLLLPLFVFGQQYEPASEISFLLRGNYQYGETHVTYTNRLPWIEFQMNAGVNTNAEFLAEARFNLYYTKGNWKLNLAPTPFNFSSKWTPDPDSRIYRRKQRVPTDVWVERKIGDGWTLGIFWRVFDLPQAQLKYTLNNRRKAGKQ